MRMRTNDCVRCAYVRRLMVVLIELPNGDFVKYPYLANGFVVQIRVDKGTHTYTTVTMGMKQKRNLSKTNNHVKRQWEQTTKKWKLKVNACKHRKCSKMLTARIANAAATTIAITNISNHRHHHQHQQQYYSEQTKK